MSGEVIDENRPLSPFGGVREFEVDEDTKF
jgi:hypothetical protein